MGTDIHFYVEKKVDGAWALAWPTLVQNQEEVAEYRCGARGELYNRFPGTWVEKYADEVALLGTWEERFAHPLYIGRNYDLFAILASVRNGRGFAGVKTGEGFIPICEPKGIPQDASVSYAWEVERWSGDGHSHSWLTVQELLNYNWDRQTGLTGWVGPKGYREFKENGSPSEWAGMVSGRDIRHLSHNEMDEYVEEQATKNIADKSDLMASVFTKVEWNISYRECAKKFLTKTLPALQVLGDPNDVRICFFFDN